MIKTLIIGATYLFKGILVEAYDKDKKIVNYIDPDGAIGAVDLDEFMNLATEPPPAPVLLQVPIEVVKTTLKFLRDSKKSVKHHLDTRLLSMDQEEFETLQGLARDALTKRSLLSEVFGEECIKNIEETL